jgi:leucyl aminopeptidase
MRIRVSTRELSELRADIVVCFAFEGDREPRGVADRRLRAELAAELKAEDFRGRPGDRVVWNTDDRHGSRRFMVVGLGAPGGLPDEKVRLGSARAARAAAQFSASRIAIRLPPVGSAALGGVARAAAEGVWLGGYRFDRYLTDPSRRPRQLAEVELAAEEVSPAIRRAVARGELTGRAVCLARDLVNEAPSRLAPAELARRARDEARAAGLRYRRLEPAELRRLGMRALLAVARGSERPPQVVHLAYRPRSARGRKGPRVLLVGKGVTFDSGGLNLKTSDSMLTMKMDMSGAAAVLAAMTALPAVGCRVAVDGLLGLVENMGGGDAYKPGDIVETWSGKTVEIGNTDAEGRLVLCDLLAYGAARLAPTHVVDVATLTGACVVALGTRIAGLFTRHDALRDALLAASRGAGEKLWPLPLHEDYLQDLQKGPADLRNVGGRWGGAITAALFLAEFVPRDLSWAHLDIAGPAFTENDLPEAPSGGTGAGVATLLRWLEEQ